MPQPYKFRYDAPGVIRVSDGTVIMPDIYGYNWREYLDWMYAGGVADPADPPTPQIVYISKMTVVNRLTTAEAEAIEAARPSQPAKDRLLWEAASQIDPSNSIIVAFLTQVLGAERANEVLMVGS